MQNKSTKNFPIGDGENDLDRFKETTWSDNFNSINTIKGAQFWAKSD